MSARQTPDALPRCKRLEANGASGLVPNALLLHLGRGSSWMQLRNAQNSKQQKITEPAALPKELGKKRGRIHSQLDSARWLLGNDWNHPKIIVEEQATENCLTVKPCWKCV